MSDDASLIIQAIEAGDKGASERLLPLVYEELRRLAGQRLARERPGNTLQATALVHEAYLRLVGGASDGPWNGKGHFFGAAAEAMRRILIERARGRAALKRGGDRQRVELEEDAMAWDEDPVQLLQVDAALTRLAAENARMAELVKLRFFAGLSMAEAAASLGVSTRTAERDWVYARAWLYSEIQADD